MRTIPVIFPSLKEKGPTSSLPVAVNCLLFVNSIFISMFHLLFGGLFGKSLLSMKYPFHLPKNQSISQPNKQIRIYKLRVSWPIWNSSKSFLILNYSLPASTETKNSRTWEHQKRAKFKPGTSEYQNPELIKFLNARLIKLGKQNC